MWFCGFKKDKTEHVLYTFDSFNLTLINLPRRNQPGRDQEVVAKNVSYLSN